MRLRPVHKELGAEVLDFDVLADAEPKDIEELRWAFDKYQLLLFRGAGRIPPERHVELVSWFGPPAPVETPGGELWGVLRNEGQGGEMRLPFHSDFTFTETPTKVISMHAIELPRKNTSTSFVSTTDAWSRLSPDQQDRLADMTVRHVHSTEVRQDMPDSEHTPNFVFDQPVRFLHPRTGRPLLFVTEYHSDRINEVSRRESDDILGELFAHLYAPEHVYVHLWRPWDLVIWDNLACQHARTEEPKIAHGGRAMQRVSLAESTYAELCARARELGVVLTEEERRRQLVAP